VAEYHYHVSPRFPYTIACWHGDTSNISYEHGGQPGQEQWSFDNARARAIEDRTALLPCCSDEGVSAPAWVERMQPYAPIDHDNLHIHRAAASLASRARKSIWMYALHGDWGTDEVGRMKKGQASGTRSHESGSSINGYALCNGTSAGLLTQDCNAWQDLFDSTSGIAWVACTALRTDPCSCLAANGEVACGAELSADDGITPAVLRIMGLGLQVNGLNGTLPSSLADMTALTDLQLEGNHVGLPGAGGLGGLLPSDLPFEQYVGCGLEGNTFICPLPPDAIKYCGSGQPLTCVASETLLI